tara:strand:+ start:157 stop:444 length:288 start_codon:yes stop_codon:yes gene_type:complete
MKNKIINTFAAIGVITVIVIACSSALSEDDDVTTSNNTVIVDNNTITTGTSTTNTTVQQGAVGTYTVSCVIRDTNNDFKCVKMDTRDGSYVEIKI